VICLPRWVCTALGWHDALGRPKLISCRVGLLRLHRAGLIALPAARNGNGNGQGLVKPPDSWPVERPLGGSVGQLGGLRLEPVPDRAASRLRNGLIARWYYLGFWIGAEYKLQWLVQVKHVDIEKVPTVTTRFFDWKLSPIIPEARFIFAGASATQRIEHSRAQGPGAGQGAAGAKHNKSAGKE
jgi:hypothetical protein